MQFRVCGVGWRNKILSATTTSPSLNTSPYCTHWFAHSWLCAGSFACTVVIHNAVILSCTWYSVNCLLVGYVNAQVAMAMWKGKQIYMFEPTNLPADMDETYFVIISLKTNKPFLQDISSMWPNVMYIPGWRFNNVWWALCRRHFPSVRGQGT